MLSLDVTSDDSVEAAVAEVMRRDGRIDLLVNNAGFGVAPAGASTESGALGGVSSGAPTMSGAGVGTGAAGSGIEVPVVAGRSPMAGP